MAARRPREARRQWDSSSRGLIFHAFLQVEPGDEPLMGRLFKLKWSLLTSTVASAQDVDEVVL